MHIIKIIDKGTAVFHGEDFPYLTAKTEDGPTRFGSESLSKKLLDKDDMPINKKAMLVDNNFYAYLPNHIFSKPDREIISYIEKHID